MSGFCKEGDFRKIKFLSNNSWHIVKRSVGVLWSRMGMRKPTGLDSKSSKQTVRKSHWQRKAQLETLQNKITTRTKTNEQNGSFADQ